MRSPGRAPAQNIARPPSRVTISTSRCEKPMVSERPVVPDVRWIRTTLLGRAGEIVAVGRRRLLGGANLLLVGERQLTESVQRELAVGRRAELLPVEGRVSPHVVPLLLPEALLQRRQRSGLRAFRGPGGASRRGSPGPLRSTACCGIGGGEQGRAGLRGQDGALLVATRLQAWRERFDAPEDRPLPASCQEGADGSPSGKLQTREGDVLLVLGCGEPAWCAEWTVASASRGFTFPRLLADH